MTSTVRGTINLLSELQQNVSFSRCRNWVDALNETEVKWRDSKEHPTPTMTGRANPEREWPEDAVESLCLDGGRGGANDDQRGT
jgi:hypothetical protein